jgi:hypothetical protein
VTYPPPSTPPGFGPPGQEPALHGRPLAAPGYRAPRGLVYLAAFFAGLLVVSVVGFVLWVPRHDVATVYGTSPHVVTAPLQVEVPEPTPIYDVPAPARYTGTGSKFLRIRKPEPDTLLYVKGNAAGERFFVTRVLAGGVRRGVLIGTFEPYEGVTVLDLGTTQETRGLQIDATGPWTVEVRAAGSAPEFGRVAKGTKDTVLRYTGPGGIAKIVGGSTRPGAAFSVHVYDSAVGQLVALLLKPGTERAPWAAGPVLVEVKSSGPWSISVS